MRPDTVRGDAPGAGAAPGTAGLPGAGASSGPSAGGDAAPGGPGRLVLRAAELRHRYRGTARDALDGVSLAARSGECLAVLGPNGSGKSTLLSVLAGSLVPDHGQVWLGREGDGFPGAPRPDGARTEAGGLDGPGDAGERAPGGAVHGGAVHGGAVPDPPPPADKAQRHPPGRRVAWLPQIERLSFALSVFDYALLGRLPHVGLFGQPAAADRAKVESALAAVGVSDLAGRAVNGLSGGELQLARIARCLVQETPVIVLDEPTAMLDPAHALAVARCLADLAASGRAIVFSTHDPALASHAAARSALIGQGRIRLCGPSAEVLRAACLEEVFGVPFGPGGWSVFGAGRGGT